MPPESTSSFTSLLDVVQVWLATEGLAFGIRLLGALLIFVVGRWVAKFVSSLISGALTRAKIDATLNRFITRIAYTLLLVVVVMAALDMIGVRTTSLVAIIGAAGLAIGLAMQGALANFAAGVLIIIFRPFKIGDFIDAERIKAGLEAAGCSIPFPQRDVHLHTLEPKKSA